MSRSKLLEVFVYWFATLVVILAAMFWSARISRGAIPDCMDATCRITTPDGSRGTGCAFEIDNGLVYILTAAHVVGEAELVEVEFWRQGHQSEPLGARVAGRSVESDAAILAVARSAFGASPPAVIPLAPRDRINQPGETITSVGCANGSWSTAWKGHVLRCDGGEMRFVPTPANGRSGSAIFDADGQHILAIVNARLGDNTEGIATPVSVIYHAFDTSNASPAAPSPEGQPAEGLEQTQCGPSGCPSGNCPNGSCPTNPPVRPNYLLPYRYRHEEEARPLYPTLPPAYSAPPIDVRPLDDKLGRIAELLGEIKSERARGPASADVPPAPPVAAASDNAARQMAQDAAQSANQALELAKSAQAETAKFGQATEGLATQVKDIAGVTNRLSAAQDRTSEAIARSGTLGERIEMLKQRVDERVGDDASKPEKIREFIHEAVTDKTEWMRIGLIVALALPLVIFAIDLAHHKKSGDPLLIEKLAARLNTDSAAHPVLVPAANFTSHAATDVTGLLALLNQQAQAQRPAAPPPDPAAPVKPA